jgi:hypothetical protein
MHRWLLPPVPAVPIAVAFEAIDIRPLDAAQSGYRIAASRPANLDRSASEIHFGFLAAQLSAARSKYTASGVRLSSALWRRLAL